MLRGAPPRHTAGMTTSVYLVDDSKVVRERLHALLGSVSGVQIVGEAETAAIAIAGILEVRPDIVVLDLNLAEGSGLDVLRALHAQAPEIDCYMLSNFSSYPYRQIAERFGVRGYFDKSREFERMRDVVAQRVAATH
jgi:DNA-binding NarL/FixJ family response regulator